MSRRTANRVVSLSPSNTEILCALGLLDRLVGIDGRSDYPPEVKLLPRVGRTTEIDVDRVAALEPDLVVASPSIPGTTQILPGLEGMGIRTAAIDPKSLGDVLQSILTLGEIAGCPGTAEQLVNRLSERMDRVAAAAAGVGDRPRVYWEWWPKPLISPGRGSWVTDMIEMAGGVNIFGDFEQESVSIDEDLVFGRQPDVIVASWCGAEQQVDREKILSRRGWDIVPAVQNDRVYVVDEEPFGRPGPRLVDGLEQIARILHPGLFV